MKRTIKTLSVLCGGLLFVSPLTSTIFAQNTNNKPSIELIQSIDVNKKEIIKNEEKIVKTETKKQKVTNEVVETNDIVKEDSKTITNIENKNIVENTENKEVIEETTKESDKSTVEVIDVLNQDQAKELLEMYHKDVNYMFQGDEKSFEALTQRGLSGYVFLPDYETDLGFFVDKNTASIYYFHPSGYLESAL